MSAMVLGDYKIITGRVSPSYWGAMFKLLTLTSKIKMLEFISSVLAGALKRKLTKLVKHAKAYQQICVALHFEIENGNGLIMPVSELVEMLSLVDMEASLSNLLDDMDDYVELSDDSEIVAARGELLEAHNEVAFLLSRLKRLS